MRSVLILLAFAVTSNALNPQSTSSFDLDKCTTLRGAPGRCVPVTECPRITSQLATERSSISFVLQGDRCGSRLGQSLACCPNESIERKETTTTEVAFDDEEDRVFYSTRRTTAKNPDSYTTRRSATVYDFPYPYETTRRTTLRDFDDSSWTRTTGRNYHSAVPSRTTGRYYDFDSSSRTTERYYSRPATSRTTERNFNSAATSRTTERNFNSAATSKTTVRDPDRPFRSTTVSQKRPGNGNGNGNKNLLPTKTCGVGVANKILGGSSAGIDEFPWLVLLQYRRPSGKITFDCSGALISSRYVLTAAHCVNGSSLDANRMVLKGVRLGEWDLNSRNDCQGEVCNSETQDMEIEEIVIHHDYNPGERVQTNDIALIRLAKETKFNQFIQPICLPFDNSKNYEGKALMVAGWGRTSNERGSTSHVKLKVKVPVVEWSKCSNFYETFYGNMKLSRSQICAGGEKGRDTCQGDSGGPLMDSSVTEESGEVRWVAIGIVSSGPAACGVEDRPSVYTKVSDFTDWILNNIKS